MSRAGIGAGILYPWVPHSGSVIQRPSAAPSAGQRIVEHGAAAAAAAAGGYIADQAGQWIQAGIDAVGNTLYGPPSSSSGGGPVAGGGGGGDWGGNNNGRYKRSRAAEKDETEEKGT